ncbi:MAG: helix-turn-helix domain-containing GNAT family N-acetyltransferase [Alphaproteobacteria bacterium]|nr:helix-turn-helix domain-containing GNAT family N-acetyltransferase [Alphaproteobacteria bacterium]
MNKAYISSLRRESRKLVREWGLLQLNQSLRGQIPSHCHALIEIGQTPGITVTALSRLLLLSPSAMSRIIDSLEERKLIKAMEGMDKREKSLEITQIGLEEIKKIDTFSNPRIIGALDYLTDEEQKLILEAIAKYADALEKSRLQRDSIKIHTLSTSRAIRQQVVHMIETVQVDEFSIPITPDINACIFKAEEDFSYNNRCHFWYATDEAGVIVGSVGLKRIKEGCGEVKKFFVHKNYRGKGIAHKLMKKMVQAARKNKFEYLYLGTVPLLRVALSFYTKAGFESISKKDLPKEFELCPLDSVFFKGRVKKIEAYFS